MPRVVSKNLFNFKLEGLLDEDVEGGGDDADGEMWDMEEYYR